MKKIVVYTDGACSGNQYKKNVGGWGAIILDDSQKVLKKISGKAKNTSNNKMELTAVIKALQYIKESIYDKEQQTSLEINLYSDSAYIVNCFKKKWIDKWQRNGWRTSSGKPVKNKKYWVALLNWMERPYFNVNIKKVEAHAGHKYNEIADRLAVQ